MVKNFYQFILLIFLIAIPLIGENQNTTKPHKNEMGIIIINDTLFGTDKDYTGSMGAYYRFKSIPLLIKYQIDAYTPRKKNKELTVPEQNMHPYAGFGYLETEYKILNKNLLATICLQLGSTGKNSYAKGLQDKIHTILNQSTFSGWDSQIQTKFGYIFNTELGYIFNTKHFTLLPAISLKIGNLLSKQTVGIQFISGFNYNQDFLFTNYSNKPNYNILILYDISNISKNVFLTGFEGYKYGVDIINTVSELKIGFNIQYKPYGFTFQNHYQSNEYKSQKNINKYSTLVFYYKF